MNPTPQIVSSTETDIAGLLSESSDADLFKFMAKFDQDAEWAEAAFTELHRRHADYVWKICCGVTDAIRGEAWAEDIFRDAFIKAFEVVKAEPSRFDFLDGKPADEQSRLIRAWLGKAAEYLLREILRGHEAEQTVADEKWETFADLPLVLSDEDAKEPADERHALILEAIDSLSEREQLVIRTTFQFYRVDKKYQRMPNKDVADLAVQLATTSENLRKIRERAMDKVKEFVFSRMTAETRDHSHEI